MRVQRGTSHIANLFTATISRACWTLPVTSCCCTCTSSHMDGTIRQGITPSCRTPTTRAGSHDITRALKKKQTSRSEGLSTRAHVPLPSVTCTVHSANRTHHAGHVGFHTRAHVKNPSSPNSLPSLTFVRPRDQQHHRVRFRTGSLLSQPCSRWSRTWHSTDYSCATMQTRHGPKCNYCRYPAFFPP